MSQMVELEGGSLTQNVVVDKRFIAESDLERNVSTASSEFVRYAPIGNVNQSRQIEFQVEPSVGYIDLKNSYIHSQIRILKAGNLPTDSDDVTFKPFISLLQWSDIKTFIGDVELSDEQNNDYPLTAFSKIILSESNLKGNTLQLLPGTVNVESLTSSDTRNLEGIFSPDTTLLTNNGEGPGRSMSYIYSQLRNRSVVSTLSGFVDTMTHPKDGIWSQPDYLQPNLRIRCVLTKNDDSKIIEDAQGTPSLNFTVEYGDVFLYLKRVYPTPSMGTIAKQLQMDKGMIYTLVRARSASVSYSNNQTTLSSSALLAGQNPSIIIVGFYRVRDTGGQYHNHEFNSDLPIQSLFIRVGGQRVPQNFDYERRDATQANSLVDYNEYVLACKASSQNTTLSDNETPLLSYEAYKNFSVYVFNCKSNKETMWGRDDSSNSKGAVDIIARFPSLGRDNSQNRMVVIGLGHDKVHISAEGKVQRLGW